MRKVGCSALMIVCLVLTACGSTKQQMETARERMIEARCIQMTAQVQADFGEVVEHYTLDYRFDGEQWTVTVIQPECVAGVTARITEDASELEYDGAILTTGDLVGNGVVPISAVPMIWETLRIGTLDSVWTEGEYLVGTYIYDDAVQVSVWFDGAGNPVAGELAENGIVKASCQFTNVKIEANNNGTTEETDLGRNQPEQSGT